MKKTKKGPFMKHRVQKELCVRWGSCDSRRL